MKKTKNQIIVSHIFFRLIYINRNNNSLKIIIHLVHEQILHDVDYDDFLHFMVVKRPIVERALRQNENNIFYDYSSQTVNEK